VWCINCRGQGSGSIFVALNAHDFEVVCTLPPPPAGKKWCRVVDTNLPPPKDFTPGGNAGVDPVYGIQAHSTVLLLAKDT
jgi:isoamylase